MKIIYSLLMCVLLLACTPKNTIDEKDLQQSLDSLATSEAVIDDEVVGSILEQIPSPLEISVLIKQSGNKYNSDILNAPGNISRYNNNYKQALNLGIYGADLGYTNIYSESIDGIRYLSSIKSLADELSIGHFFDISTISHLASNSNNLDSLLLVTTQNFNSINHYLQTQNRSNLSVLLLIGGWIEAMEIISNVAVQNPQNRELTERIGEQKIILEQMVLLLSFYNKDQNMATLLNELQGLKTIFDKINITYTYKESTMAIVNGVAVIKDNSSTTINITEKDVTDIKNKINLIRSNIIS